jgi:ribosome-binding protein aMBF1 (putative translation factor)
LEARKDGANGDIVIFKAKGKLRVIHQVKKQFSDYIIDSSDEYEDWFETDLHKEIAKNMKPCDYMRNFREAHGTTQKELAEKLEVRVNYLSDMETGQRAISRVNAKKLGALFNVNPGVFI